MYQEQDIYQEQARARFVKRRADEAVALAMESHWEEATQANRDIIAMLPTDPHAYNRLGKALMELGRYAEARDAYARALELDSTNTIAKKNLSRLAALGEAEPGADGPVQKLAPHLFIAETGRTAMTALENPDMTVALRLTPGDQVELRRAETGIVVYTMRGERIGDLEPRMGLRLASLIEGGNMYAAAVVSVDDDQCRIIVREVYQDPSQEGRPSFPTAAPPTDTFRSYTRAGLVRADKEEIDEELLDEEWEEPEAAEADTANAESRIRSIDDVEQEEEFEEEEEE